MKKAILLTAAATLLFAGDQGIRPRPSASDYPAHQNGPSATIAAGLLSSDQVKKIFAEDLTKLGYVVVEVAVYPDPDKNVAIAARDFMLRVSPDGSTARPVSPATISAQLHKKDGRPPDQGGPASPVQVYVGQTVGYESGPYGHGTYTGTSVGVGVGNPGAGAPAPPPQAPSKHPDSLSMQVDLENQALPEGHIDQPVAGYLYFPKLAAAKQKKASLELMWYGADGQLRLVLPTVK